MDDPIVTIVILTMGEAKEVIECLENQTYRSFEIIIAKEKGIVNAMNKALEKARGEIFVRVDDDVEIPERWLESLLFPFSDPNVAGATGPTFVPGYRRKNRDSIRIWERPNWFLRWLQDNRAFAPAAIYKCGMVSYDSNYRERFGKGCHLFTPDHLEGTNWAMRTELIRRVGGFDPAFDGVAEWFDTDVEQKIKKLGYTLRYSTAAYLWHLVEKGEHFDERFAAWGRIKNWLRYHLRHSKLHWKMAVYLLVWMGYFMQKRIQRCLKFR